LQTILLPPHPLSVRCPELIEESKGRRERKEKDEEEREEAEVGG